LLVQALHLRMGGRHDVFDLLLLRGVETSLRADATARGDDANLRHRRGGGGVVVASSAALAIDIPVAAVSTAPAVSRLAPANCESISWSLLQYGES